MYTDPVTLRCGHSFCRLCITDILERQKVSRAFTCPDCRAEFRELPDLQRNVSLYNITTHLISTQIDQEKPVIFCTYCDIPKPAVKSCLQCEISMCDHHLVKHNKSVTHTVVPATTSSGKTKSDTHQSPMEASASRTSCMKPVEDAVEIKKGLQNILQKLVTKRKTMEKNIQSLQEFKIKVRQKAAGRRERVVSLIRDLRRQLEGLEKRVLHKISKQEEQILLSASDLIRKLETEKDGLYSKMLFIEDACCLKDPLPILLPDAAMFCQVDKDEDTENDMLKILLTSIDDEMISKTIQGGLTNLVTGASMETDLQKAADSSVVLMDLNTAGNHLIVSEDLKTASWIEIGQNRPETPERFEYYQALSLNNFCKGQHSWEVEISRTGRWRLGVAYSTIDKKGGSSFLGNNKKSWCLRWCEDDLAFMHDSKMQKIPHRLTTHRLRMNLNYEAGQLFFYELCEPIRHLHTFTTKFTEPLHAAFCVWTGSVRILN
ncbi:E3 ubiquitin/ISG15 ligase TRIM25-like [Hyperolius riggenbachi]|uniref:E3 ubiquitin/ISG15 ligase TRIM25-like n=1 Tax=Hyperolius riggenbachi TaxID=752182 RepID=UPI0035A35CD3